MVKGAVRAGPVEKIGESPITALTKLVFPRLKPHTTVDGRSAVQPTPRGPVAVSWLQSFGAGFDEDCGGGGGEAAGAAPPAAFSLRVALPGAVEARLCLPATPCAVGAPPGTPRILLDGEVREAALDGDYACVGGVGGGEHVAACPSSGW